MKKISILLAVIMFLSLLPTTTVLAELDPYNIIYGKDYTKASTTVQIIGDLIHSPQLRNGQYAVYEKVNFGKNTPYMAEAYIFSLLDTPDYVGGTVEVRLDSIKGEKIAQFKTLSNVAQKISCEVATEVTGVHDLYLVFPDKPVNLISLSFQGYAGGADRYSVYKDPDYLKDISETGYKSDIYTLIELGLIKPFLEDEYNPYIGITRGEFAVVIANILTDNLGIGTVSGFSDVDLKSMYAPAVSYLENANVVFGNDEKLFQPDIYISSVAAVTMIVRALGYENLVRTQGGEYPSDYLDVATKTGILKGVALDDILRRDTMARLIINAINADYVAIASYSKEYEKNKKVKGILSKTRKIYKGTGVVDATSDTNLMTPDGAIPEGMVFIDKEAFNVGKTNASALLGYDTIYYYIENDGEKTIVSISPSKRVEITTINTKNGDVVNEITEKRVIYYDSKDEKTKTITFAAGTHMIYNGKAIDDSVENLVDPGEYRGVIRVVDCGDKTTLFFDQYSNIWVKSVHAVTKRIYDGLSDDVISFDVDNSDLVVEYGDKKLLFKAIGVDDILSVYKSKNKKGKKLIRIVRSKESIYGTITETMSDTVYIDGKAYKISKEANQSFKLGLQAYFRTSIDGEIVCYSSIQGLGEFKVGMFLDYDAQSSTLSAKSKFKIFETGKSPVVFPCADRIKIDGYVCKNQKDVVSGKGVFLGLDKMDVRDTLVRYRLNENGEIEYLDTARTGTDDENDILTKLTEQKTTFQYNGTSKIFVNASSMRTIAPFKQIPPMYGYREVGNQDTLFYSPSLNNYADSTTVINITGDIYTLDAGKPFVDYVVWFGTSGVGGFSHPFVFDKMASVIVDDEICYKIYGKKNDIEVSYYIKQSIVENPVYNDQKVLSNILKNSVTGDVLRVMATTEGEISSATIVFLANGATTSPGGIAVSTNKDNGLGNAEGVSRFYYTLYGTVVDKLDSFIKVEYNDNGTKRYEYFKAGSRCMRYDYKKNFATLSNNLTLDEIIIGDKIFAAMQLYETRVLCVYNHFDLN